MKSSDTAAEIRGRHFSCFYMPEHQLSRKPQPELEVATQVGSQGARTGIPAILNQFAVQGWCFSKALTVDAFTAGFDELQALGQSSIRGVTH